MVLPGILLGKGKIPGKPVLILAPGNSYSTVSTQVMLPQMMEWLGMECPYRSVFAYFVLSW